MCAAAACAFHRKVKIVHYGAGITNSLGTFDEWNRHCISIWSDIQLCENVQAQWVVWDLKKAVKLPVNSYNCGTTHLDDLVVDECKVPPDTPYDLILYNTPTKAEYEKDIEELIKIIANSNYSILIGGNPDGEEEAQLVDWVDEVFFNLPRPEFLGLLKNCKRFITNSSSAIYEAPYFLREDQIIQIGERNKNRPKVECKPGGADKIVEVLQNYYDTSK